MNEFISVKQLKKEPFLASCDISFSQHCAMDVVLEEVFEIKDLNLFVLGVGECVYYSQKQPFENNRRNWAYKLTDREIVFGDMQSVNDALEEISANGLKTVCVLTCIPCIMNLDTEGIENSGAVVVKAPDFKGISAYDILDEFYFQLLKNEKIEKNTGVSYWDADFSTVEEIRKNLQAGIHVVRNKKYLGALNYLKKNSR